MAGSTRIAMRKYTAPEPMTVEYMVSTSSTQRLSDHLGSTSLTADADGNKVLELRYKACPLRYPAGVLREGEIRATWTSSPSTTPAYKMPLYQYTGQASYMDDPLTSGVTEGFGLMFYQSRFYDPYITHFVQADTIVPQEQGTQAWDRYAGMNNNPIVYKDPTGHTITQGDGGCTSKADCAVVSQAVIRDLINQGQIDEAIKLTVIYYRIDTHGATVSYDKNLDSRGTIIGDNQIVIGPHDSLSSPGMLGSTIYHESVHIEQHLEKRNYKVSGPDGIPDTKDDILGKVGLQVNELEAYNREKSMSGYFHLSSGEIDVIDQGLGQTLLFIPPPIMDDVYPNYSMDGITICDMGHQDEFGNCDGSTSYGY